MDISIEISASDEKCLMPFLAANDWSSKYIGCEMQWSITITSHDNMTATMIIRNLDCSRQCTRWSEQILSHRPHSKTLSSVDRQATWEKYYLEQKNKLCSRLIFFYQTLYWPSTLPENKNKSDEDLLMAFLLFRKGNIVLCSSFNPSPSHPRNGTVILTLCLSLYTWVVLWSFLVLIPENSPRLGVCLRYRVVKLVLKYFWWNIFWSEVCLLTGMGAWSSSWGMGLIATMEITARSRLIRSMPRTG